MYIALFILSVAPLNVNSRYAQSLKRLLMFGSHTENNFFLILDCDKTCSNELDPQIEKQIGENKVPEWRPGHESENETLVSVLLGDIMAS